MDWTTGLTDFHFKHISGGSIIRLKRHRSRNSGAVYNRWTGLTGGLDYWTDRFVLEAPSLGA